jgi:chemotaxis receptor (MCP) glutamine deamidase CheD
MMRNTTMQQPVPKILVEPDAFRVARNAVLMAQLCAAMAVCVHDDTQGVGGLLHLRYVATNNNLPLDLTDNTLSSNLLLMDRFCKELRVLGARKQSWRVCVLGHTPEDAGMTVPAATVFDLVKAYFADSRLPVQCKEINRMPALIVHFNARDGHLTVGGAPGSAADASRGTRTPDPRV